MKFSRRGWLKWRKEHLSLELRNLRHWWANVWLDPLCGLLNYHKWWQVLILGRAIISQVLWIRGINHNECLEPKSNTFLLPILFIKEVSWSDNAEQERHLTLYKATDLGKQYKVTLLSEPWGCWIAKKSGNGGESLILEKAQESKWWFCKVVDVIRKAGFWHTFNFRGDTGWIFTGFSGWQFVLKPVFSHTPSKNCWVHADSSLVGLKQLVLLGFSSKWKTALNNPFLGQGSKSFCICNLEGADEYSDYCVIKNACHPILC